MKYFGVIGIGLIIIVLLAYLLRRKEQMRAEDEAEYGTYADEEKKKSGQMVKIGVEKEVKNR